jgi:hypothetical protein
MRGSLWLGRLLPVVIVAFSCISRASADGPAISEMNGLVGSELGYLRDGRNGGTVTNGSIGRDGVFRQCPNNDCISGRYRFSRFIGGGGQRSGFAGFGGGQAAIPLGHDFGLQLDGDLGGVHGGGAADAAVHLFRGDPDIGLIGPSVDYRKFGDADYLRLELEGQFYLRDFTFHGDVGYQWGQDGQTINAGDGAVGCGYVAFYPVQTLMLLAGGGGGVGEGAGFGQIEWQPSQARIPGLSFFAEGMAGTHGSGGAFAGLRYHFGAGSNLETRHRHELLVRDTPCGREQFTAPGTNILNIFDFISG